MEDTATLGLAIAFTAGFLSFLSPCVLPLIPSYVTFVTGLSLEDVQHARRTALVHSLLFILGFTLIFLALGAGATVLGTVMFRYREWITRIGGVVVILFGLYMLGAFNPAFLARERRVHLATKPFGYLGTVLVGIAFGAGWTPCLGPILGAILMYTSGTASPENLDRGLVLLGTYSMGLAVPFLLSSLAINHFLSLFQRLRPHLIWVTRVSGVLLIVVGLLLVTNYFTILASMLQRFTPAWLLERV
jgi:cytochrome c-type biogenesis protein